MLLFYPQTSMDNGWTNDFQQCCLPCTQCVALYVSILCHSINVMPHILDLGLRVYFSPMMLFIMLELLFCNHDTNIHDHTRWSFCFHAQIVVEQKTRLFKVHTLQKKTLHIGTCGCNQILNAHLFMRMKGW